jgi:hypothetical protein
MTGQMRDGGAGVSLRALLIAFALLALIAPAAFYGELVYGTTYMFASGVPAMAPLVILFLLTALNPLVRKTGLSGLTRRELLAIYGIVIVGGPLVTHGILAWMIPYSIIQQYLARAIPNWVTTYFAYIPRWFGPTDLAAVENYFQGQASVPWSLWATPLAAWSAFLIALFMCTVFLVILFRRQWITSERLSFPLAQVPLEMVQEGDGGVGASTRLPRAWAYWIGFLIPMTIGLVNGLSGLIPAIPSIEYSGKVLMQRQATGPLAGLGEIDLVLDFWMIALAFLIPKELSFSCWLFWSIRVGLTVAAIAAGATPESPEGWYSSTFPAPYYQGGGTVMALGVWVLWIGRKHLARSFRLAFGLGGAQAEDDEPLSYRWAFLGFLICFGFLVYFCWLAGARLLVGLAIVTIVVAYYVMWARLRAETGLGFLPFPLGAEDFILVPFGSSALRPSDAVVLITLRWTYFPGFGESFEVCTGNALESFKIADSARIASRPLFAAMIAGFVLSVVFGIYVVLTGMYHYGFFNIRASSSGWLGSQLRYVGERIYVLITDPTKFDLNGTIGIAVGAVMAILLGVLRLRFWWWPLHPIGYLAANCWGMHWYWMPLFVGWLLKTLTIRYGGLRLYRRMMPVAIGLIVGDMVSSGLWVAVNSIVRAYR